MQRLQTLPNNTVTREELLEKFEKSKATKLTVQTLVCEKNLVIQPIDKHFTCSICLEVVHQPTKCQHCEHAFCRSCAHAQREKNGQCPQCRCSPMALTRLNRYEKAKLDAIEFECPRCTEKVPYGQKEQHVRQCQAELEACPTKCGAKGIRTRDELNVHLSTCRNLLRRCACCPVSGYLAIMQDETLPCPRKLNILNNNADKADLTKKLNEMVTNL